MPHYHKAGASTREQARESERRPLAGTNLEMSPNFKAKAAGSLMVSISCLPAQRSPFKLNYGVRQE